MPDGSPWFTKPWINVRGERRGIIFASGYLVVGACFLLLALAGSSNVVLAAVVSAAGLGFLALGSTLAATVRWRHAHGADPA